jgi:hypothetical protein
MTVNELELDWPDGFSRTKPSEREPYPHDFRVDIRQAFRNILAELSKRDVDDVRIESAASHLKDNPNLPYANANPDDPGVVAYFTRNGTQYAVPCDQWDNLRDNAQAIAKYLNAKRALERYAVKTVENKTEMAT